MTPTPDEPLPLISGRQPKIIPTKNMFDEPVWRIDGLRSLPGRTAQMPAILDHNGKWREIGDIGAGTLIDWPTEAAAIQFIHEQAAKEASLQLAAMRAHGMVDAVAPLSVPEPPAAKESGAGELAGENTITPASIQQLIADCEAMPAEEIPPLLVALQNAYGCLCAIRHHSPTLEKARDTADVGIAEARRAVYDYLTRKDQP